MIKHRKKPNVIYKNTLREQQKEIMKLLTIKKLKKAILFSRSVLLDRTLSPNERGNTCEAFNSLINALQEATK